MDAGKYSLSSHAGGKKGQKQTYEVRTGQCDTHDPHHPQGMQEPPERQRKGRLRGQAAAAACKAHAMHLSLQWQVLQCPGCSAQHTFVMLCLGLAVMGQTQSPPHITASLPTKAMLSSEGKQGQAPSQRKRILLIPSSQAIVETLVPVAGGGQASRERNEMKLPLMWSIYPD